MCVFEQQNEEVKLWNWNCYAVVFACWLHYPSRNLDHHIWLILSFPSSHCLVDTSCSVLVNTLPWRPSMKTKKLFFLPLGMAWSVLVQPGALPASTAVCTQKWRSESTKHPQSKNTFRDLMRKFWSLTLLFTHLFAQLVHRKKIRTNIWLQISALYWWWRSVCSACAATMMNSRHYYRSPTQLAACPSSSSFLGSR